MIIARYETRKYEIILTGHDRIDTAVRLIQAWPEYCKRTGADPDMILNYSPNEIMSFMTFWDTNEADIWIDDTPLGVYKSDV